MPSTRTPAVAREEDDAGGVDVLEAHRRDEHVVRRRGDERVAGEALGEHDGAW